MEHGILSWSFGDPTGWTVACVFFLALFSALYLTSLSGFSQLELDNDQSIFRYMLPKRTTRLPFHEVIHVREEPAYKGQWRLILTTESNGTYERALAFRTEVHKAGEFLRQQMVQSSSLQR